MRSVVFHTIIAALLATSMAIKVSAAGHGPVDEDPGVRDIEETLLQHGFILKPVETNQDPVWITGERKSCEVMIANVSAQGWHARIVDWYATGKTLRYSFAGQLYEGQQPRVKSLASHYLSRLKRYAGLDVQPIKIRAIISSADCPQQALPLEAQAALS